jgi:hypothetical protein
LAASAAATNSSVIGIEITVYGKITVELNRMTGSLPGICVRVATGSVGCAVWSWSWMGSLMWYVLFL